MMAPVTPLPVDTLKGNQWLKLSLSKINPPMTPMIPRIEAIMPHHAMMMPPIWSSKQNKNLSSANAIFEIYVFSAKKVNM